MEQLPMDQIVEIDADRFVALSFDRVWPKYIVSWSVRRRAGESDFPIANGSRESLPPPDDSYEEMWERLRSEALDEAQSVAGTAPTEPGKKGLLGRLRGR